VWLVVLLTALLQYTQAVSLRGVDPSTTAALGPKNQVSTLARHIGAHAGGTIADKDAAAVSTSSLAAEFDVAVGSILGFKGALPLSPSALWADAQEQDSSMWGSDDDLGVLIARGSSNLTLADALRSVKLPSQVAMLFRGSAGQPDKEAGLDVSTSAAEKAVDTLNDMILEAWARLDAKSIECAEAKMRGMQQNRQIGADLARLGQQAANSALGITKATTDNEVLNTNTQQAQEELDRQNVSYTEVSNKDQEQLKERTENQKVSEYILDLTKCPDAGFLQQHGAGTDVELGSNVGAGNLSADAAQVLTKTGFQACFNTSSSMADWTLNDLHFADPLLAASTARLSPEGRGHLLRVAMQVLQPPSFVQARSGRAGQPAAGGAANPRDEKKAADKCASEEPNCGVLHDIFASLWGEMRDLVDETTDKIASDSATWEAFQSGINMQLQSMAAQKGQLQSKLAEATGSKAEITEQQTRKQAESAEIQKFFTSTMNECRATIHSITFTEICGIIKIRNEFAEKKLKAKRIDITDCEVGKWVTGECSKPCDDDLVGGTQNLTREVIVARTSFGAKCPSLKMTKSCNQIKCPIDCQLGEWDGFSTCTKECGGGVQQRTRKQLVKPRNGGISCRPLMESRPCNTDPCDVNCMLSPWTPFSSCSQSCDGGRLTRQRNVITAPKGQGTCDKATSTERLQANPCNEQECVGDEECLSEMDLVIALDASGSIKAEGFEVLKEFASNLVERMKSKAYGHDLARVGVVQFGNGELDSKKIVSDAKLVTLPLASMDEVSKKIKDLAWLKGFTNMAQGFLKARNVLETSSRKNAKNTPGVVLVITDGNPSFKHSTSQAVKELRESARVVMVHVKEFRKPENVELLRGYASFPPETNYIHIPGKDNLKQAYPKFVTEVLARLCPRFESPSATQAADNARGFSLVREAQMCQDKGGISGGPSTMIPRAGPEPCLKFAESVGDWKEFATDGNATCVVFKKECSSYGDDAASNVYKPTSNYVQTQKEIDAFDFGLL
jgi:uncharacterized protein YegL